MATVYLNNAATSWPKAPGVAEAVHEALVALPSQAGRSPGVTADAATRCRSLLAARLGGVAPERVVLTSGATQALNLAIFGLGLRRGQRVLTTVTEHNSVLRPLNHLAKDEGIIVDLVGVDEDGALRLDTFTALLERQPRVVILNHMSNVTGRTLDAGALFALAKSAGATTLLDASQSIGHQPVEPEALRADMVAFTGHKGLLGPQGTGGLYVAPEVTLRQVLVGGTGVRADLALHPEDMPTRLEAGTRNTPGLVGLGAALEWLAAEGDQHLAREHAAARRLREGLRTIHGVRIFGDEAGSASSTMSFRIAGWGVEDAALALAESFGVACRSGLHCAPLVHAAIGSAPEGSVRFSVSGFTRDEELETALAAVERLAG